MSETRSLADALRGNFVVTNLGCVGDPDSPLPDDLLGAMTLIEIDAAAAAQTSHRYHRKISVQQVVAGKPGKATFRLNTFIGSSSLLAMKPELVRDYGMEPYSQLDRAIEVDCITIPQLLEANGLKNLDVLKTDLEGLDFAVVQSCEALLPKMLCIQSEIRFQPFYETEPHFDEFVGYLRRHGFELTGLYVERWKYRTPGRFWQTRGRPVWGDGQFFLAPERVLAMPENERALAAAKQIIIAVMLHHPNLGEYLLEKYRGVLPTSWQPQLTAIVQRRLPRLGDILRRLRHFFLPVEFRLRQLLGRSQHVATQRD
jgi:FkbM family methyltransferase